MRFAAEARRESGPIMSRKLEGKVALITGSGRGIGRYGASQLPDVTLSVDGTLHPIGEYMVLAGGVLHLGSGHVRSALRSARRLVVTRSPVSRKRTRAVPIPPAATSMTQRLGME